MYLQKYEDASCHETYAIHTGMGIVDRHVISEKTGEHVLLYGGKKRGE